MNDEQQQQQQFGNAFSLLEQSENYQYTSQNKCLHSESQSQM
jgi:hypothetical protein